MSTYTAAAERSEGWWGVHLVEEPGLYTQTRRLDQIPKMVRDALKLFPELETDPDQAEIIVRVLGDIESQARLARERMEQAKAEQEEAMALMRRTARSLHQEGLSFRDVGELLGVSHQRAQQLAAS